MSPSSVSGALRIALTSLSEPVKAAQNAKGVTASPVDPAKYAELQAYKARCAARELMFRRMEVSSQAGAPHESHDISLPNIESLDLGTAKRVRDCVEVDVATGADKGMTVHASYGDKIISSLKEYFSAITKYIGDKTKEETTLPSSPPSEVKVGSTPPDYAIASDATSVARDSAIALYKHVSSTVLPVDTSASQENVSSDSARVSSIDAYLAQLAERAATDIIT